MSYSEHETSADEGSPVELYHFSRVGLLHWRYTSADRDYTQDSQIYLARAIRRSQIEQGPEPRRSGLTVTAGHDLPVIQPYKVAAPSDPILLTLRQVHHGDVDAEASIIWQGRIVSVRFAGEEADIALEPMGGDMKSTGLRRNFQKGCPHDLYGPGCGVDKEDFRTNGTVDTITGEVVSVSEADALPDGYFSGGMLLYEVAAGVFERRFITEHAGANLTLDAYPYDLLVSAAVILYAGCDHVIQTCHDKFDNRLNYGGQPYIPVKNPFGGSPIY